MQFKNGQLGKISFHCKPNSLINEEILEGEVIIPTTNLQTGLMIPSQGEIKLTITYN